ncbi:hypothetical protein TSAR_012135 [Trichomalopsis sarcophagae]|uniref:Uncharacterized protein n=1 Tax=Trichomalopsis sarcophagae TaxID=543379 RepID=A0A232EMC4_9HYME|nr:hypothetical protein TSAR_012135 [Trichomalopsis sarcophagae]
MKGDCSILITLLLDKRHLATERRQIAKNSLRHMKPKRFKVEEAKKLMDNSDIIPSLLSNSVVYKTARQEIRDQDLKLENYPGNPIESLHEMMDDISAVKMISTYPLIVMYWTEEQIKLWNEANELDEVDISIDASGSFILDKMLKHDLYYGQKLIICSFNQISDPKFAFFFRILMMKGDCSILITLLLDKRHLATERRQIAKNSLRHMKPKRFKVEEAKKLMDNSDIIPSLLSNSVVYKTARQEIRDQDLKLENYPGNPIKSLHEMMDDLL